MDSKGPDDSSSNNQKEKSWPKPSGDAAGNEEETMDTDASPYLKSKSKSPKTNPEYSRDDIGSPTGGDLPDFVVVHKAKLDVQPLNAKTMSELHASCLAASTDTDDEDAAWRPLSEWLRHVFSTPTESGSLDIDAMRNTIKLLFPVGSYAYQKQVASALNTLSGMVRFDMMYRHKEFCANNPNYLNLFIILFELPLPLLNDDYESGCEDLCRLLLDLPATIQAELIVHWSRQPADWLKQKVTDVQQVFTIVLCMMGDAAKTAINQCQPSVTEPIRVLHMLRLASIIGALNTTDKYECQPTSGSSASVAGDELDFETELTAAVKATFSGMNSASGGSSSKRTTSKSAPSSFDTDQLHWALCRRLNRKTLSIWDVRSPLVDEEEFVNEELAGMFDMQTHYVQFKRDESSREAHKKRSRSRSNKFLFFPTYAFLLTADLRLQFMYIENKLQQESELRENLIRRLLAVEFDDHYLTIRVRRDHLIEDSLIRLNNAVSEGVNSLRKPLRIEFDNEPGVDEGGVSKEFYQLIFEQLFNPDYAMFVYNEKTRQYWFNPSNEFCHLEFRLIGILLGLAVYNSVIVDVHFPSVVWRKLFSQSVSLDDLQSVDPVLYSSLKQLLEYEEDDIEDVFCQTFRVTHTDVYGELVNHDLVDDGDQVLVNKQNREEFVRLYVEHLLVKSVRRQFDEFSTGFNSVVSTSGIKPLFSPQHIEMLICGTCDLDFHALEKVTKYDNGFSATHVTVQRFWNVVHSMDNEEKKLLLKFTTGCDRVPLGGISKINFIIARNGDNSDRLPTAHTCFNALLLPNYKTEDILRARLLKAVYNCHGFGLQ